jgi:hypothetical protein
VTARLLIGDVHERLADIPDNSIDLIVTSPPFLALRSYLPPDHPDKAKEIGSEATPADFLDTLLALTVEWRRILTPYGSICVELGDTYSGSGGAGGDYNPGGLREGQEKFEGSGYVARDDTKFAKVRRPDHQWGHKGLTNLHGKVQGGGRGWPLDKSLTGIPTLYAWSLATAATSSDRRRRCRRGASATSSPGPAPTPPSAPSATSSAPPPAL